MAKDNEKFTRDNSVLLDLVYQNLVAISDEIQKEPDNPKLIDAFDSLLSTYFDIMEDF